MQKPSRWPLHETVRMHCSLSSFLLNERQTSTSQAQVQKSVTISLNEAKSVGQIKMSVLSKFYSTMFHYAILIAGIINFSFLTIVMFFCCSGCVFAVTVFGETLLLNRTCSSYYRFLLFFAAVMFMLLEM